MSGAFLDQPSAFCKELGGAAFLQAGISARGPGPVVPLRFDPPAGIFLSLLLAEILRAVMQSGARLPSPSPHTPCIF